MLEYFCEKGLLYHKDFTAKYKNLITSDLNEIKKLRNIKGLCGYFFCDSEPVISEMSSEIEKSDEFSSFTCQVRFNYLRSNPKDINFIIDLELGGKSKYYTRDKLTKNERDYTEMRMILKKKNILNANPNRYKQIKSEFYINSNLNIPKYFDEISDSSIKEGIIDSRKFFREKERFKILNKDEISLLNTSETLFTNLNINDQTKIIEYRNKPKNKLTFFEKSLIRKMDFVPKPKRFSKSSDVDTFQLDSYKNYDRYDKFERYYNSLAASKAKKNNTIKVSNLTYNDLSTEDKKTISNFRSAGTVRFNKNFYPILPLYFTKSVSRNRSYQNYQPANQDLQIQDSQPQLNSLYEPSYSNQNYLNRISLRQKYYLEAPKENNRRKRKINTDYLEFSIPKLNRNRGSTSYVSLPKISKLNLSETLEPSIFIPNTTSTFVPSTFVPNTPSTFVSKKHSNKSKSDLNHKLYNLEANEKKLLNEIKNINYLLLHDEIGIKKLKKLNKANKLDFNKKIQHLKRVGKKLTDPEEAFLPGFKKALLNQQKNINNTDNKIKMLLLKGPLTYENSVKIKKELNEKNKQLGTIKQKIKILKYHLRLSNVTESKVSNYSESEGPEDFIDSKKPELNYVTSESDEVSEDYADTGRWGYIDSDSESESKKPELNYVTYESHDYSGTPTSYFEANMQRDNAELKENLNREKRKEILNSFKLKLSPVEEASNSERSEPSTNLEEITESESYNDSFEPDTSKYANIRNLKKMRHEKKRIAKEHSDLIKEITNIETILIMAAENYFTRNKMFSDKSNKMLEEYIKKVNLRANERRSYIDNHYKNLTLNFEEEKVNNNIFKEYFKHFESEIEF